MNVVNYFVIFNTAQLFELSSPVMVKLLIQRMPVRLHGKLKKVVLAYSGGLDTSVIVTWLKYV